MSTTPSHEYHPHGGPTAALCTGTLLTCDVMGNACRSGGAQISVTSKPALAQPPTVRGQCVALLMALLFHSRVPISPLAASLPHSPRTPISHLYHLSLHAHTRAEVQHRLSIACPSRSSTTLLLAHTHRSRTWRTDPMRSSGKRPRSPPSSPSRLAAFTCLALLSRCVAWSCSACSSHFLHDAYACTPTFSSAYRLE